MDKTLIIIALSLLPLTAMSEEWKEVEWKTTCECSCHGWGDKECISCRFYHERQECPCPFCHGKGCAIGCAKCGLFHSNFERYGIEEAIKSLEVTLPFLHTDERRLWKIPPLRTVRRKVPVEERSDDQ